MRYARRTKALLNTAQTVQRCFCDGLTAPFSYRTRRQLHRCKHTAVVGVVVIDLLVEAVVAGVCRATFVESTHDHIIVLTSTNANVYI